jgi:hypothetical protein
LRNTLMPVEIQFETFVQNFLVDLADPALPGRAAVSDQAFS